jgi:hypothetical protein
MVSYGEAECRLSANGIYTIATHNIYASPGNYSLTLQRIAGRSLDVALDGHQPNSLEQGP